MAPQEKSGGRKQPSRGASLSDQGHRQILDYLRVAETSAHPEIRKQALKIAAETGRYERRQKARVSPSLILAVNILTAVATVAGCWYALLHYPAQIAWKLCGILIAVFLVMVGLSIFLAGRLSEAHFMTILSWPLAFVKNSAKWVKARVKSTHEHDDAETD